MAQRVFLVHGWSVQETTTYQTLHFKLAPYGNFKLGNVYLGRYRLTTNDQKRTDASRHAPLQTIHNGLAVDSDTACQAMSRNGASLTRQTRTKRNDYARLDFRFRDDEVTRIDVVLSRTPSETLFVSHPGDDPDLHVKWNGGGAVVRCRLKSIYPATLYLT